MLFNTLALISFLIILLQLNTLVEIFPSLMACLIRWKESVNLDASVKLSRDRNILTMCLAVPFCLTASRFMLYSPSWMSGMLPDRHLAVTIGIFAIYVVIRNLTEYFLRPKQINPKTYKTACRSSYTFFSILTLILMMTGGTLSFMDVPTVAIRNAMLWISTSIYALFLLRKFQIFNSSCSFFTAFLYLCALEIIPTGALVVSVVRF